VETGGVRLRSRIVERPVEEHVRLREETVNVERNAVNRPVSSDDLANFKEQNIELTEHAEVPVVNKEARVVEEIRVSKDVTERDETIRDNVRHTEVDIDNLNKDKTRDDLDSSSSRSGF
jgi:stress response protein YsnF